MKKLSFFLLLTVASGVAFADIVETPTGSPVSDILLLVGVLSIAVLLFVRYRRARQKH